MTTTTGKAVAMAVGLAVCALFAHNASGRVRRVNCGRKAAAVVAVVATVEGN